MPTPFKITGTSRFSKSRRKPQAPLFPGDAQILKQIEKQKDDLRNDRAIKEPLEYTGQLKDFRPAEIRSAEDLDICLVCRSLLSHRWAEFPRKDNGSFAIGPKVVAEAAEFRASVPQAVSLGHIYGIFPNRATRIDRAVNAAAMHGAVRIISTNAHDGSLDLVMEAGEFYRMVEPLNAPLASLCRSRPDAQWFEVDELVRAGVDVGLAVSQGLLVVNPGKAGVHQLAIVGQGRLLKLIRQARTWLLQTILKGNRKFRELPESVIKERLEGAKKYWYDFRGLALEQVLWEAIGSGYIDGFRTPIGRGWKVLHT